MTTPVYTNSPVLLNFFRYKSGTQANQPLVGGKVYFFSNTNRNYPDGLLDTYSSIDDPNNPVVNENPITLGQQGEFPLTYLQDESYFIQVYDSDGIVGGTLQWTFENVMGSTFDGNGGGPNPPANGISGNLLANGQFNYPIDFNVEEPGTLLDLNTNFALGWQLLVDDIDSNKIFVIDIANQQLEGSPQKMAVLESSGSVAESQKDFVAIYGYVDSFSQENFTLSFQAQNFNVGTTTLTAILYLNYGVEGSDPEYIELGEFTVTQAIQKFSLISQFPNAAADSIGGGNYGAIIFRFPIGSACNIGVTNVLLQLGAFNNPIYLGDGYSFEKSQILGNITYLSEAGQNTDYFPMTYSDGSIFPLTNTGEIITASELNPPPNGIQLTTDAQTLYVSESTNGIPNSRLYAAIGNTSDTGLIVTAEGAVITGTSFYGFNELTPWDNGIAPVTTVKTQQQLLCGISLSLGSSINTINATFTNNFAPNQNSIYGSGFSNGSSSNIPNSVIGSLYQRAPYTGGGGGSATVPTGNNAISSLTTNPGSPSTPAQATLSFNSNNPFDYRTFQVITINIAPYGLEFNSLNFSSISNNSRGNYLRGYNRNPELSLSPISVRISVDGSTGGGQFGGATQRVVTVPFLSSNTLRQNIVQFMRTVANPFIYSITINSVPVASDYLLFSDASVNYYVWYQVNGSGTDPALPGRTGIMVALTTPGDTIQTTATKTATAMNSLKFDIPATHCPYSEPFFDYILQ